MYGGPRLYRFYNYEQLHYFPAPVGGWNPDAPPWELPVDQAHVLDNFLVRGGKISMRGAMQLSSDLSGFYSPYMTAGYVMGMPDYLTLQAKVPSATAIVDPWFATAINASAAQLAVPQANAHYIKSQFGTPHAVAVTADQSLGPRWINFDGTLYGLSYGASTAPTTVSDSGSNYTTWATNLLTLPGTDTSVGGHAPTVASGAPRGGWDLKGYQSRIWMLSGCDTPGGSTAHKATAVYFTNPISAGGGMTAADWKDPVSGLTNKIIIDNNVPDYNVGLAVVRGGLMIFRRRTVWLLRGSTSANYTVIPVSGTAGCIDARSIVETMSGVYWLSDTGLMFSNGTTVTNVSGQVEHTLAEAISFMVKSAINSYIGGAPFYACAALGSQNHLIISLGVQLSSGNYEPIFSAVYDINTKTWARFNSQLWTTATGDSIFGLFGGASGPGWANTAYPGLLVSRTSPHYRISAIGDRGVTIIEDTAYGDSVFQIEGAATSTLMDLNRMGATASFAIPAAWQTGFVPVVSTSRRRLGIAKRFFVDYLVSVVHNASNPTSAWTVTPVDATDTSVSNSLVVPLTSTNMSGSGSGGPIRFGTGFPGSWISRANQDLTNEIADLSFLTSWTGGSASGAQSGMADIYGLGVEFQSTRDAR